jgi:hypothetical protein
MSTENGPGGAKTPARISKPFGLCAPGSFMSLELPTCKELPRFGLLFVARSKKTNATFSNILTSKPPTSSTRFLPLASQHWANPNEQINNTTSTLCSIDKQNASNFLSWVTAYYLTGIKPFP